MTFTGIVGFGWCCTVGIGSIGVLALLVYWCLAVLVGMPLHHHHLWCYAIWYSCANGKATILTPFQWTPKLHPRHHLHTLGHWWHWRIGKKDKAIRCSAVMVSGLVKKRDCGYSGDV